MRANKKNVGFAHTIGNDEAEPVTQLPEYLNSILTKINQKDKQSTLRLDKEVMMEAILFLSSKIDHIAFDIIDYHTRKLNATCGSLFVSFDAEEACNALVPGPIPAL